MTARPTLDHAERRRRLVARHHLAGDAASPAAATRSVLALHGTDPTTVVLSLQARVAGLTPAEFERAAYQDRTLVRMLGMRRTVFVLEPELAPIVQAACTDKIAANERRRVAKLVADQGHHHDPARWLEQLGAKVEAHLAAVGEAPAKELSATIPELATKLHLSVGKPYAGTTSLGSQLLAVLAAEGRIVRARPLGTWTSSQFRWARTADWLGRPLPAVPADDARARLVGRWLERFGPGTVEDVAWWTGLPLGQVRAALAAAAAVEVELEDGRTAHVAAGDVERTPAATPVAALLPSLDPTTMGWKDRSWYLGDHGPRLFDRNGNGGPTVWWDGRIVGGWAQHPSGAIRTGLLEDLGAEAEAAIAAQAERLAASFGEVRVRSRFPTPLERELLG